MITREDIIYFYDEYKKNLTEGAMLSESVFAVDSVSAFEEKLLTRRTKWADLIERNNQLIKKYVMPIANKEQEMTKEIADEIVDQTYIYLAGGYSDQYGGLRLLLPVEEFYNKNEDIPKMIKLYLLIGYFYKYSDDDQIKKSVEYYKKQTQYLQYYFETDDWPTKRLLLLSLYNYSVQKVSLDEEVFHLPKEELVIRFAQISEEVVKAIEFYNREDVRLLANGEFDFDGIIEEFIIGTFASMVTEVSFYPNHDPKIYETAAYYINMIYEKRKDNQDNLNVRDDKLHCAYLVCQYLSNKLTKEEFVRQYFDYCKQILDNVTLSSSDDFYESRYLHICNHYYRLLYRLYRYEEFEVELKEEITRYYIDRYLHMMEVLPKFKSPSFISTLMYGGIRDVINDLPSHISKYHFIMNILINNDETMMVSAVMVRSLASTILSYIFEEVPEILIGSFGTDNTMDVLMKQEEITDYVRKAALIYDIGKTMELDFTQIESRHLNEYELERIRKHPEEGVQLINLDEQVSAFKDVVLGHHKYYDGKGGYPKDYDNTKSEYRIIVDLITICDCMNAATDYYGRYYKQPITFEKFIEELDEGAGTRYNPDIVNLIKYNKKLQSELKDRCITNRRRAYYETYYEFVNKGKRVKNKNQSASSQLPAWAKNALRVVEVDFAKDTMKTIYRSSMSITNDITDGSYSNFPFYSFANILHPSDVMMIQRLFDYSTLSDKLGNNNGSYEVEARVRLSEHEDYRWLRFQFLSTVEDFGIPQVIIVIVTDADDQCRRRQRMQETLEQAKDEAKAANRAKNLFLSNISHQIRTPMNAIIGMTEMMFRTGMSEEQLTYMCNIKDSSNALLSLINDILDFSKMESGIFELNNVDYSISDILDDIAMVSLKKIADKPIELLYEIDENMPKKLNGDVLRIRQVLANLMSNAFKFTERGYALLKIKVNSINEDEIDLTFSVKDTGIGICGEDLNKLFAKFSQVDVQTNYDKEGSGLGLVISKQIVEMMKGSISVDSDWGKGSTFSFNIKQKIVDSSKWVEIDNSKLSSDYAIGYFFDEKHLNTSVEQLCATYSIDCFNLSHERRHADIVFTDAANAEEIKASVSDDTRVIVLYNPILESKTIDGVRLTSKPLYSENFCRIVNNEETKSQIDVASNHINFIAPRAKILIVDDTPMNLTVAKGLLAPLKIQIETAQSGYEAIEKIQSKSYNMVFMDHKMPGMDGIETVINIRKMEDDYFKNIPIIALTANAVLEARDSFYKAGMNDFVAKPIDLKIILQKIYKWLPDELIEECEESDMSDNANEVVPQDLCIEGLDIAEGLKNSGGFELFATLVCDYYKLIDSKTCKIKDYLTEGMIKEYTIEVHAMKSVSRVIGALELSEQFKELEALGDKQDVDALYEKTPVALEHYLKYKTYLKDFVEQRERLKERNDISKEELIEVLEIMITSMQTCDLDMVDECMNKLDNSLIPDELSSYMEKLSEYIADVAMEESIQVMTDMLEVLRS